MGRPPCCDKVGVKKGPWTPEEDIMLASYVQEHGPANWKAVPESTGLTRCSKSCRLRWTNYLRPGIKRGSFTEQEEKMIIQLQALLGNKWAAIASYLPERTDNEVKNYWNTHLKKKLKKLQIGPSDHSSADHGFSRNLHSMSRGQWERRLQADINTTKQALHDAFSFENTNDLPETLTPSSGRFPAGDTKPAGQTFAYAFSTENIARLLKEWVETTPRSEESKWSSSTQNSSNIKVVKMDFNGSEETYTPCTESKDGIESSEPIETLFRFETFESPNSDEFSGSTSPRLVHEDKIKMEPTTGAAPLSMIESWVLDEDPGRDYLTNFLFDENPDLF